MDQPGACPKCAGPVAAAEKFCAKCGFQVEVSGAEARAAGQRIGVRFAKQSYQQKIQSGRTTILVIAVLVLIGSGVVYFLGQSQVEKAEKEISVARGNLLYDQERVAQAEKEVAAAKSQVVLLAIGNLVLAVAYFGLWVWAKTKPLPATLIALILFLAIQAMNLAIDPKTVVQGILIKIIILLALIHAVTAAQKYQKMQQQGL